MTTGQYFRKTVFLTPTPFPVKLLRKLSKQNLLLPFYHSISDERLPHLAHLLKIRNCRTFANDLEFFLKHYQPVDARELVRIALDQNAVTRPVFHLSFDDGLKEMVTTVAPILVQYGIPATFFINTGFFGNKGLFYRYKASILIESISSVTEPVLEKVRELLDEQGIQKGKIGERLLQVDYRRKAVLDEIAGILEVDFQRYQDEREIYMNGNDIRTLMDQGFTIGAHSIDHPEFRKVSPEEQVRQTLGSMQYLKDTFDVSPAMFSFPFSDEEVGAGYFRQTHKPLGNIELSFGTSGMKKDSIHGHLHRIPMETGDFSAEQIVKGEYLYFLMKTVINKNTIHRK